MFIVLAIEVMQGYGSESLPWSAEVNWVLDDAPERADRSELDVSGGLIEILLAPWVDGPCF